MLWSLVAGSALACQPDVAKQDAKRPIMEIIEGLKSADPDLPEVAAGRLADPVRAPMTLRERLHALTAAAHTFPPRIQPNADSSADLIAAAGAVPNDAMIAPIEHLFDHYSRSGKVAALNLLSRMPSRRAAIGWMSIVNRHLADDVIPSLPFGTLTTDPRHADVFLPTVLEQIEHERFGWDFALLSLRICKRDMIAKEALRASTPIVINRYRRHEDRLRPHQKNAKSWFRFEDAEYRTDRAWASLLLDLMSCLPSDLVNEHVRRGMTYRDPRLQYFAVASSLRLTNRAPKKRIHEVAANAEMRSWLFDTLQARKQLHLMPSRYRTQASLAESELVAWLSHENELGRPPDSIVLEEVVSLDTETPAGIVDYYVFRFRVSAPHWAAERGWMAGVAGGYTRDSGPTTDDDGNLFSRFEAIDDRSPADHVGDLEQLYDAWQERYE